MSRLYAPVLALFTCLLAFTQSTIAAPLAKAVKVGDFQRPTYIVTAPDQGELLFIVQQSGVIRVLRNEVPLTQPFLDITAITSCCSERGLLSMAFAPNYSTSGLFYVAFTNRNGDVEIDEFQRSGTDATATRALRSSRRRLLTIPHREAANHNGGQLQFGPDGYLYISVGDGGGVFPRGKYARDLNFLLGKLLRIDPTPGGGQPYQIPSDNPFVGTGNREEIFAYGFRNPWRFSFDGHRIAIADVGQSRQEEINFLTVNVARGTNFGWPQYEGKLVYDNTQPGPGPAKFPILVYSHNNGGCAVVGGFVSHDPAIPTLRGRYLYGDLCTGQIRAMMPDVAAQTVTSNLPTGINMPMLTTFGVGPQRQIYFGLTTGQVWRISAP